MDGVLDSSEDPLSTLTDRDFAGVIFDMDGTLIDSTPAVERSWLTWAREFGLDTGEGMHDFHGVPARGIITQLLPAAKHQEALDRIVELELADVDGVVPLPGAIESLQSLPVRAIATSCTQALARRRIAAAGLPAPEVVVTADDVTHGKPHPAAFLLAAERLGIDPTDALVVEDATSGLRAARDAGCASLAVVTTTPRDKLEELAPDLIVPDLGAVRWRIDGGRIRVQLDGDAD